MRKLLLLFTIVPLVDLWLLTRVGVAIGPWGTLALVVLPAFLGAWMTKREGLRVLRAWQRAWEERRMPEEGVVSGLLVLVGGVLLVTPGLITDTAGLLLLVPAVRRPAAAAVRFWLERRGLGGRFRGSARRPAGSRTIDVTPRHRA